MITSFYPLLGGLLIGVAAAVLWAVQGRIAGISGILGRAIVPVGQGGSWRWWFLAGMLLVGVLCGWLRPDAIGAAPLAAPWLVVGGLLTGVGTSLSGGCTSGHGVCGLGRLSTRSLVATLTFMTVAVATVGVVHRLGGHP